MLKNTLYFLTIIFLISFIYIKLRYRFWSSQPIFRTYNLLYWIKAPGIIQHEIIKQPKFFDHRIQCSLLKNLDAQKKALLLSFIKMNYKSLYDTNYNIAKDKLLNIFTNDTTVSLQYNLLPKRIVSCLLGIPLICRTNEQRFEISYLDQLCIHRDFKDHEIRSRLIHTHYYKSRKLKGEAIFLYKDYGLPGIRVPLTIYKTYLIHSERWCKLNMNIPNNISTQLVTSANSELLVHFIKEVVRHFDCVILPKTYHLAKLIKLNYLMPTVIMDKLTVVAVIFFRRKGLTLNGDNIIECAGSYCRSGYEDTFIESFQNSMVLLSKRYKFSMLSIENISYNYLLLKRLLERSIPKRTDITGYYFYNCAHSPLFSPNVLVIN